MAREPELLKDGRVPYPTKIAVGLTTYSTARNDRCHMLVFM